MSAQPHIPVLLAEVLAALSPAPGDVVVDGTFGAGGYSRAILKAADCRVIAIDRDPNAQAAARDLTAESGGRLNFVAGRFGDMDQLVDGPVQGVALDIGVSSMQLDQAERGFSFSHDGPLDMRMEQSGPSAADVVNHADADELADIFYHLGEERHARRVARAIIAARAEKPFERTAELANVIRKAVGKSGNIDSATRSFQGLRIHVNDELGELERGLAAAERILAPGGRLAVVTFHSLEDRIVKNFLKTRSGDVAQGSRHLPQGPQGPAPTFTLIGRKSIGPGAAEEQANPRARSAKLRAAIRTQAPAWGKAGGR